MNQTVFKIGRDPACNPGEIPIFINDPSRSVSTSHCKIWISDNQLYLQDLNSKNGTYVNGKRIQGVVPVHVNDKIHLGKKASFSLRHPQILQELHNPSNENLQKEYKSPISSNRVALYSLLGVLVILLSVLLLNQNKEEQSRVVQGDNPINWQKNVEDNSENTSTPQVKYHAGRDDDMSGYKAVITQVDEGEFEYVAAARNGEIMGISVADGKTIPDKLFYKNGDNPMFLLDLDEHGRPKEGFVDGIHILYSNYTDSKVDIAIVGKDGKTEVVRDVEFDSDALSFTGEEPEENLYTSNEHIFLKSKPQVIYASFIDFSIFTKDKSPETGTSVELAKVNISNKQLGNILKYTGIGIDGAMCAISVLGTVGTVGAAIPISAVTCGSFVANVLSEVACAVVDNDKFDDYMAINSAVNFAPTLGNIVHTAGNILIRSEREKERKAREIDQAQKQLQEERSRKERAKKREEAKRIAQRKEQEREQRQIISIREIPSSFFGNWYTTDGNNTWHIYTTEEYFMVGNVKYNYSKIEKLNSDSYLINLNKNNKSRKFYVDIKNVNYISFSSDGTNYNLHKKKSSLPNRIKNK